MTADLIAFLHARLDEDEQVARAATLGPWLVEVNDDDQHSRAIRGGPDQIPTVPGHETVAYDPTGWDESARDFDHIARHDPARVLAEVDAKRRIIDLHDALDREYQRDRYDESTSGQLGGVWFAIRFLALPYADHPDYRAEWAPDACRKDEA